MPVYCQRCGKPFQDTARILNHMNQPISSCRTYYEEVLQIAEAVHRHSGPPKQSQPSRTNQPKEDSFEMDQSADGPPLEPAIVPESRSSTPIATDENPIIDTSPSLGDSPFFAEIYPASLPPLSASSIVICPPQATLSTLKRIMRFIYHLPSVYTASL